MPRFRSKLGRKVVNEIQKNTKIINGVIEFCSAYLKSSLYRLAEKKPQINPPKKEIVSNNEPKIAKPTRIGIPLKAENKNENIVEAFPLNEDIILFNIFLKINPILSPSHQVLVQFHAFSFYPVFLVLLLAVHSFFPVFLRVVRPVMMLSVH